GPPPPFKFMANIELLSPPGLGPGKPMPDEALALPRLLIEGDALEPDREEIFPGTPDSPERDVRGRVCQKFF
ncbi:4703_t:CDS:2, partial [Dentiscutata erythropus]